MPPPRHLRLSHPDKILFPQDGITKAELVDYYLAVAPYALPHLRERPINLERYPSGIDKPGFFQQAKPRHYPDWIADVEVAKQGGTVRHVVVRDAATLGYLANQNVIALHAWLSRTRRLDYPDQMIFDLDPPEGAPPTLVRDAARQLGELLRELGLVPFLKTSGSLGYHVVVPLDAKTAFDPVRAFARRAAEQLVERARDRFTVEARIRARGNRVYIDTLRNAYAHTAVPPFTVRARPGAPVAAPIAWEELADPKMHPAHFTIRNILPRLASGIDPWHDWRRRVKRLPSTTRK